MLSSDGAAAVVLLNWVQVSAPSVRRIVMYGRHWVPSGLVMSLSGSLRIGSAPGPDQYGPSFGLSSPCQYRLSPTSALAIGV